jgi:hypothetical protein
MILIGKSTVILQGFYRKYTVLYVLVKSGSPGKRGGKKVVLRGKEVGKKWSSGEKRWEKKWSVWRKRFGVAQPG